MRRSIGLLATVVLLSACAPVLNTGITKKNTYKDARHGFIFTKAGNWKYSIPWEKKTESAVRRFSIYIPQTRHSGGGMRAVTDYGMGRDPVTGHFPVRYRRVDDGGTFAYSLATAHFSVDTTQMDLAQINEELLKEYQDFRFAGRILIGELGEGYHLTRYRNGVGDTYFAIKEGKLYLIELLTGKGRYEKSKSELEQMLSTFTFVD